jgi:hypothetical protein
MKIKVRGGTLPGGKSLCFSCNHSDVIRGQNGQEIILCKALSWDRKRITFPVAECTMFHSGGSISLSSLKEIAWIVQAEGNTGETEATDVRKALYDRRR